MKKVVCSTIPLLALLALTACGSGQATVAFKNAGDDPGALTYGNVQYFGIKLVAIYLSEDMTEDLGNAGDTPIIYLNPACGERIEGCDVAAGDGVDHVVEDYFDFSRPTEEVNAAINAQAREVSTGIYRYVRIQWCATSDTGNNISYHVEGMPAGYDHEFPWDSCSTTESISGDLDIGNGDAVTVTLEYDLATAIAESPIPERCDTGYASCYTDGVTAWELQEVRFTPSASTD